MNIVFGVVVLALPPLHALAETARQEAYRALRIPLVAAIVLGVIGGALVLIGKMRAKRKSERGSDASDTPEE